MRTVRHHFNKVSLTFSKTGNCSVCGRKTTRSKVFWQTISPFNTAADGSPKSIAQIKAELCIEGTKWKEQPVCHAKCEG